MNWEALPCAEASTSTLPSVLVGFSSQEKSGKILPCKSVKEDGLMRIDAGTVRSPSSPPCVHHLASSSASGLAPVACHA